MHRALIGSTLGVAVAVSLALALPGAAQVLAPRVENVQIPTNVDPFNLSFDEFKKYSSAKNFELLGQTYFKIPERTPWAKGQGRPGNEVGSGFNGVRVYDGIAYLGGFNSPPTLFGILIADVRDPRNIKPLSFIPCNPGTRCNYLRVNREKKILIFGHDYDTRGNPNRQPAGEKTRSGVSFYDVSDPAKPKELAFLPIAPDGKTHGLDIDDRYVYSCSQYSNELNREGLQIIDYSNPSAPKEVGTWHVTGQTKGEQFGSLNRNGPDGKPQIVQCHEIVYYNDRIYAAWRDAGMVILDVSDLKNPEVIKGERPANVVLLSTFRFDYVSDNFDHQSKQFVCDGDGPGGRSGTTTHLPWFDQRSPSLVYMTWYDEGLRAMDISNPFAPVFVGHYLSPRTGAPAWGATTARKDRHTREIFQDPDTGLLYLTDGNGAGLMVLRYTGPIPDKAPIPGGR